VEDDCEEDECDVSIVSDPGIECDSIRYDSNGCAFETICSCEWEEKCLSESTERRKPSEDFPTCDDDGHPFNIGSCLYKENSTDNCDDGFYIYSWLGNWTWGSDNDGYVNSPTPQTDYVRDPVDLKYYYDPERKSTNCTAGGQNTVPCPAQVQIPFFSTFNLIISLCVIALIYTLFFNKNN